MIGIGIAFVLLLIFICKSKLTQFFFECNTPVGIPSSFLINSYDCQEFNFLKSFKRVPYLIITKNTALDIYPKFFVDAKFFK
jgi:hypothetical protein